MSTKKNQPKRESESIPAGSLKRASAGSLKRASAGSLKRASAGSLTQASAGSLKRASAGSLTQASASSLKRASASSLKRASASSLKRASISSPRSYPKVSDGRICMERSIFLIIVGVEENFKNLYISKNICQTDLPLDLFVNLNYEFVPWGVNFKGFNQARNGICDGTLIYALPENAEHMVNLYELISSLQQDLKNCRLYIDLNNIQKNSNLSRRATLKLFGIPYDIIPNIRIVNAFTLPEVSDSPYSPYGTHFDTFERQTKIGKRLRIVEDGNVYDCVMQYPSFNQDLLCQPWFQWYLERAFTCASGRLLQFTGTCWMNTVLNALILSKLGSYMVSVLMPILFPNFKRKFAKPLSGCPLGHFMNDPSFIFHMLYQTKCFKQSFYKEVNFVGEFSKQHAIREHGSSPTTAGQGGWPADAFIEIIKSINSMMDDESLKITTKTINRYNRDLYSRDTTNTPKIIYQSFSEIEDNNIPKHYTEAFAFLIYHETATDKGHAVCGFICDGEKAIFDSNGYFTFTNWGDEDGIEQYKTFLSQRYGWPISDIEFVYEKSKIYYLHEKLRQDFPNIC